jgi:hypothetical protein
MSYARRGQNFRGTHTTSYRQTSYSGVVNDGRDPMEGLRTEPLSTISKPADESNGKDIVIKDLTYLGSYNWVDAKQPTILVPGAPLIRNLLGKL